MVEYLFDDEFDYDWTGFCIDDHLEILNVKRISFSNETELEEGIPYKVIKMGIAYGTPIIETPDGEFELFPLEMRYVKKVFLNVISKEAEVVVHSITKNQLQYLIDKALDEEDWIQLEKLRSHMKGVL